MMVTFQTFDNICVTADAQTSQTVSFDVQTLSASTNAQFCRVCILLLIVCISIHSAWNEQYERVNIEFACVGKSILKLEEQVCCLWLLHLLSLDSGTQTHRFGDQEHISLP
jgi:hypothetical protein